MAKYVRLLFHRKVVSRLQSSVLLNSTEISQQPALNYSDDIERSIGTYYRTKDFLFNINTIVDTSKSVSYIVKKLPFYKLGDKIQLHIDLYNGYGVKKTNGGDDIRIVMVESSKNAGIAGHVIDHQNGSYTAHVLCAWVGKPVIKIFVVPEEAKPYFYHVINETIPRNIWGGFKNGKKHHYSWCDAHVVTLAKIYKEVCNLTKANFGIPWYCGRPTKSYVTCDDWSINTITRPHYSLPQNRVPNATEAELNMMSWKRLNITLPPLMLYIRNGNGNKIFLENQDNSSCGSSTASFDDISASGYFYEKVWHMISCRPRTSQTLEGLKKCLSNKFLQVIGDSTLRLLLPSLTEPYKCKEMNNAKYQRYFHCPDINMTVTFDHHGIPFRSPMYLNSLNYTIATHQQLNNITEDNRIIITTLDAHILFYDIDIFIIEVRKMKNSLLKLLHRCPNTQFVIVGPFPKLATGYLYGMDFYAPDTFGVTRSLIWRSEFSVLSKNVFYVNRWDMILAVENTILHQAPYINTAIAHVALSYVCDNINLM